MGPAVAILLFGNAEMDNFMEGLCTYCYVGAKDLAESMLGIKSKSIKSFCCDSRTQTLKTATLFIKSLCRELICGIFYEDKPSEMI